MGIAVGIVGLPNVGKSTLFNALTRKGVPAENYPFCTIDPAVGVVGVPDQRLGRLAALSQSARTVPAVVEFVDIAGLVKGAAQGEGLGNQFLSHIREVDAIMHVVRIFEDPGVAHVEGDIEPARDLEIIHYELILADLETVRRRLASIERLRKSNPEDAQKQAQMLKTLEHTLLEGKRAACAPLSPTEWSMARELHLLTAKPIFFVLNASPTGVNLHEHRQDPRWKRLMEVLEAEQTPWTVVYAALEGELADLAPDDQLALRREFGVLDDGLNALIRLAYQALGLISFYTTGEQETRAWSIRRGATAPEAGAAIHSDFQEKFIRVEVVHADELLAAGSFPAARAAGKVRIEGREYVVKEGDVLHFRVGQ